MLIVDAEFSEKHGAFVTAIVGVSKPHEQAIYHEARCCLMALVGARGWNCAFRKADARITTMRGTILLGIVFGLLVAGVFTLCVMEQRNVFGQPAWGVEATFKPGPGFRSPWFFWGVTAVIPALCGGLLGDCEWSRRGGVLTAAGAVLLAACAAWFFADLPVKHGRAGANTRGSLLLDAVFLGALAGAKLAEKLHDRSVTAWRNDV